MLDLDRLGSRHVLEAARIEDLAGFRRA